MRKLSIFAVALATVLGGLSSAADAATAQTATTPASTAAAGSCSGYWGWGISVPQVTYKSPLGWYIPQTYIQMNDLCAISDGRHWAAIAVADPRGPSTGCGAPNPGSGNHTTLYVPPLQYKLGRAATKIVASCEYRISSGDGPMNYWFTVQVRAKVRHRCTNGRCVPTLDSRYWGRRCYPASAGSAVRTCEPWSVGYR